MATIKAILRKQKKKTSGMIPIYLRIIEGEQTTFVTTGIDILEEYWDEKKQRVKSKHQNSSRMNQVIAKKISEIEDLRLQTDSKTKIRDLIITKKKKEIAPNFTKYFEAHIEYLKISSAAAGTIEKAKAVLNKFKLYSRNKDVMFTSFTLEYLIKYEQYLRSLGNKTNTIHGDLKIFRALFNKAEKEKIIKHEENPFHQHTLKWENVEKTFLTIEEVEAIDNLILTAGTKIDTHKDMFVFACYAGGIRISDLVQLRWENFDPIETKISFFIQKTKSNHSIKLPDRAVEILNKYRPKIKGKPKGYIFGMIPEDSFGTSPAQLLTKISSATAYANKNLKSILLKAEITKPASFHSSRHSWATIALKGEMPIAYVSKIMAHSKISTTLIYTKIQDTETDNAILKVFNKKKTENTNE